MPIHAPSDTLKALGGGLLVRCASRSLFQSRFTDPQASDDTNPSRKKWFEAMVGRSADVPECSPWLPSSAARLYARLMARLLVDLGGGTMENANIRLDRYGLPLIPGSAVKGCARRMALQALHDWIAADTPQPPSIDPSGSCCDGFEDPSAMLAAIARIFGWVEMDWRSDKKDGVFLSDFSWACAASREAVWTKACQTLAASHRWPLPASKPWKSLPDSGGTIAFLAASPNVDPGLELDVLTPHHKQYYENHSPEAVALDDENPVPVFFPAVKPQGESDYFTFPLIPLRPAAQSDIELAMRWLARGLEVFGLGAKTAAGYGWFDASDAFQAKVKARHEADRQSQEAQKLREAEEARKRQAEEAVRLKKEQEAAATKDMSEDQKADWRITQLNHSQFNAKVHAFFKEPKRGGPSDSEKAAIVRALRGPRIDVWNALKAKAAKGGEFARAEQAIRQTNKLIHGDKMP
jgi:CRISPR-associated protein Cmr6